MDPLIEAVNSIHDVAVKAGLSAPELPQVAVIGTQSSGKSSVLESFVKRPFLPRGKNIVTRCPLVVQMIQTKRKYQIHQELNETEQGASQPTVVYDEWVEFLHAPNKRFTDFEEVKKEIEAQMDVLAGRNKGIQNKPITIKVYSPNVVDLTVIDLPGFTKVTILESKQIENVKENILTYVFIHVDSTFTTDQLFLDDTQMSRANMDATAPFVSDGVSNVLNGIVSEAVNTISGVANNAVSGAVKGAVNGALTGALGGGITGAASGALAGALAGATDAAITGGANNQSASTGDVNWPAVGETSGPSVGNIPEAVVSETLNTMQDVHVPELFNLEVSTRNTEAQQRKCEIVRRLMTLYFNSVRKAHQDYIPKALISTVVYHVVEKLSIELTANIGNEKELTDPTEDAVQRREELKEHLASLNAVAKKIPKLRAL